MPQIQNVFYIDESDFEDNTEPWIDEMCQRYNNVNYTDENEGDTNTVEGIALKWISPSAKRFRSDSDDSNMSTLTRSSDTASTGSDQLVELDDMFRSDDINNLVEDARKSVRVEAWEFENSLDYLQQQNLEVLQKTNEVAYLALGVNIVTSFEETGSPRSPSSGHQRTYERFIQSDVWVKEVASYALNTLGRKNRYYHLNHIFDGSAGGGCHIHKSMVLINPVLSNIDNGVIYGSFLNDSNDPTSLKYSSFFPPSIQTRAEFLDFMNDCEVIGSNTHIQLLRSKVLGIHVIRYTRSGGRLIPSAFPCLAVFEFNPTVFDNQVFTIDGADCVLNQMSPVLERQPAFITESDRYIDLSTEFQGVPGILLRIPLNQIV